MRITIHQTRAFLRANWLALTSGVLILLASLVHIPASWDALNYFDPPKRLLWALMALILAAGWRVRPSRFERTPLLLSLGLLSWIVFRTLLKPHPDVELEVLFTWILPVLMFMLAACLEQARGVRIVAGILVLAGVIQAAIMLLQRFGFDPFFFDTTSVMDYKPGRMVGTIGYQNQAVDFLALSGAGILILSQSPFLRLAFMVAMLLVAGLTGNRGGVVAFTVALLVSQALAVWFRESWTTRRKWMASAAVILGLCATAGIIALVPDTAIRFREMVTDYRHSPAVGSRVVMTRVGVDLFQERPLTGWGAGEYAFQYLDRMGKVLPEDKTHEVLRNVVFAREAHNDYLQFAVEFGMVGVLLVAALLAVAAVRCARARNLCADAVLAIAFIIAYMAVSSLVSFPWQTSMGGPLAGFFLGLLWPACRRSGSGHAGDPAGMLLTVLGRIAKADVVITSLALVGWCAFDAFLNAAVPNALAMDGPSVTERLMPRYAYRYHALVGASYAAQGADFEAENELLLAQWGYRDIPLWNNLGHVQAKLHKWREAAEVYEKWARCGLDHSNALLNLSIAYEQTGRFREAAESLVRKNNLWRDPSPNEIKRLAVLQLQSGDPRRAQDTLRLYKRKWTAADSKTVAEIENLAGGIWLVLGDGQKAAKWFRSALDKNPELESARRNLEGLSSLATEATAPGGQEEGE